MYRYLPLFLLCLPLHAAPSLSPAVGSILAPASSPRYATLYRTVQSLPAVLQPAEAEALLDFLAQTSLSASLSESESGGIKNDIADLLLRQPSLPRNSDTVFLAMLKDPSQGPVWNNYVLQKLPALLSRLPSEEQRAPLLAALWSATEDPTIGFPGTALLGLLRLSRADANTVALSAVSERAFQVAQNPAAAASDRLTALQIASEAGHAEVLALARTLLHADVPVMLRASAIAVMGKQGEASDIPQLEPFLKSADLRLREAAKSALATLNRT